MTADVQRELAEALPESLGPVSLRRPSPPLIPDGRPEPRGYGDQLIEALLPTVQALIADAGQRAAAGALLDAAAAWNDKGQSGEYADDEAAQFLRDRAAALDPS